jgi:Golgi nucleoside diphosphatase
VKYIMPLFDYAASLIPVEERGRGKTKIYIQATAGMRLLSLEQQTNMYDSLYDGLLDIKDDFPFATSLDRSNIGTLDGSDEGYYGALTTNYVANYIDNDLMLQKEHQYPLGALDMGGSSTQIVYNTKELAEVADGDEVPLSSDNFFVRSYLSFGADAVRVKLLEQLIAERKEDDNSSSSSTAGIANPCVFRNYPHEHEGYTFTGTGDAALCSSQIASVLKFDKSNIDGVLHPTPIKGKFYGMSLYYFALHSVHILGDDEFEHWPSPSIQEIVVAVESFCGKEWEEVNDGKYLHEFTGKDQLPTRCLEAVYIATLLRDGYGFDDSKRKIIFAFDVNGSEVEWTMGFALSINDKML